VSHIAGVMMWMAADPAPSSKTEIYTRFAIQMATIISGFVVSIYTIFRKTGGLSKKVTNAAEAAAQAAELAKPTGNGFAKKVMDRFAGIESSIERLLEEQGKDRDVMTRHLEQHVKDSK
jgi:hypothetical protein